VVTAKTEDLRITLEKIILLIKEKSLADENVGKVSYRNGRFWCKTEDTKASIKAPFLEGMPDFCIEGLDLLRYLQKVDKKEIDLEKENNLLFIRGKRSKASFSCFESFSFSLPKKWDKIGPGFLEGVKEARNYISKSFYRPVLTTVCVKENSIQASNGLVYFRTLGEDDFLKKEETLIPGSGISFLVTLNPSEYCIDDTMIYFRKDSDFVGACALMGGVYPDVVEMKKDYEKGKFVSFHSQTKNVIERCSVFVERMRFEEEKEVYVTLKRKKAYIKVKSNIGSNEEIFKAKYDESLEGLSFCLRPDFFLKILEKSTKFLICTNSIQLKNKTLWLVAALTKA